MAITKLNLFLCLLVLILFSKCSLESSSKIQEECKDEIKQFVDVSKDTEVASLKKVLFHQQESWNNGNIKDFMEGYWKSDQLIFKSAKHETSYGWESVYQRYKKSYPDKESMGFLQFDIKDVELTSSKTAKIHGDWELERKNDHPKGSFWLNLSKMENRWVIISDSTTTF